MPKTTTRLIIPHSSPPNTNQIPNGDTNATPTFRHQLKQQQSNNKVLRESTPNINNRQESILNQLKISGGISQSNFRKSAPLSHTLQSASSIINRKQSVCDSSQHNRHVHYGDSQKENTNSLSSSNSKNSSFLESNSSQSSSNFGSSSSTNLKRISPEVGNGPNIKYQSSRHKQPGQNQNGDVQQEWEQVNILFLIHIIEYRFFQF